MKKGRKLCSETCPYTLGYHEATTAVMALPGLPEEARKKINLALIKGYKAKHREPVQACYS